jgi:hypothetical protein
MSYVRPILRIAVIAALVAAGAVAPLRAQSSAPGALRTVAIAYKELSPSDPAFKALWTLDPKAVPVRGYPPKAYVGYVREASGSLLTITMLSAPDECGPNLCSMKIIRDGRVLKEFVGCDDTDRHRITADGRYLMVCDATLPIPP